MKIREPTLARTGIPLVAPVELNRRLPAAEQVYRLLRDAIITCQLEPNEAISENRICNMFGVSRSPVRIAVTRLAEDGLIEIFPQRGTFVAPIRIKKVLEAQFARTALEVALAEQAAGNWTDSDTAEIGANLTQQMLHAQQRDAWSFFLDNESFHQMIARAARLEGVWSTVQTVKTIWDRIGHLANRVPAHTKEVIAEHQAILRALEQRNAAVAASAMRQHMHSIDHAIERLRPLHIDYFVDQ